MEMNIKMFRALLSLFSILCHFVYLECFWNKKKKRKKIHEKKLEWMQICNCAFLYQSVWLNVGSEWCINNYTDVLTELDGVAFKDWNTFAYLRWNPMMSNVFLFVYFLLFLIFPSFRRFTGQMSVKPWAWLFNSCCSLGSITLSNTHS